MRLNDLSGKKFGNLTVVKRCTDGNYKRPYWICLCDCGNTAIVKGSSLTGGITKSCGCLKHRTKHGDARNHKRARLLSIYHNMVNRCYNEKSINYKDYGGRGLKICSEWKSNYKAFKSWAIENGYNDFLSIDRIDVNCGYEPANCRWVDRTTQNNNKRNSIIITAFGKTLNAKQWSNETGIKYSTIISRYHRGLPPEDILRGGG